MLPHSLFLLTHLFGAVKSVNFKKMEGLLWNPLKDHNRLNSGS